MKTKMENKLVRDWLSKCNDQELKELFLKNKHLMKLNELHIFLKKRKEKNAKRWIKGFIRHKQKTEKQLQKEIARDLMNFIEKYAVI